MNDEQVATELKIIKELLILSMMSPSERQYSGLDAYKIFEEAQSYANQEYQKKTFLMNAYFKNSQSHLK